MLAKWYWKLFDRKRHEGLLARVKVVSPKGLKKSWYYHIDFGYGVEVRPELKRKKDAGLNNWRNFLAPNLPDLTGKRILNIGCNTGLYDLGMLDAGAAETVGIDFSADQAEFIRDWFAERNGKDYTRARFIGADVTRYDLTSLGRFDLATLFCVAYHLGDAIDRVMEQLRQMTPAITLQGNLPRLTNPKYRGRSHQHLAGVSGMSELLRQYGYTEIEVVAPEGYEKPLVIGCKAEGED